MFCKNCGKEIDDKAAVCMMEAFAAGIAIGTELAEKKESGEKAE